MNRFVFPSILHRLELPNAKDLLMLPAHARHALSPGPVHVASADEDFWPIRGVSLFPPVMPIVSIDCLEQTA
jgi:hypothetical protein